MALGAYSLLRFSNDLNDQRVNLGVLLWHPYDGFHEKVTPYLNRAKAVDPRVSVEAIKTQIKAIRHELTRPDSRGDEVLLALADRFRHGVEVSSPYPAEMSDSDAMMDVLYRQLVSPVEEFTRASTQKAFSRRLETSLKSAVARYPTAVFERQGLQRINGIAVDVGLRTAVDDTGILWRALSLQSVETQGDQLARAKAAALDVRVIKDHVRDVRDDKHVVAVLPPRRRSADGFRTSVEWLKHEADDVLVLHSPDDLGDEVEARISRLTKRPR